MIGIDLAHLDASTPLARPLFHGRHYAWVALGMLALTVYGSLIPFHFRPEPIAEALATFRDIRLHAPGDVGARGDWSITLVLFTCLSFVFMGMACVDRPPARGLAVAVLVILGCTALSVAIEFTQIFFPPRTVSLNDLILQAAGGLLGTVVWIVAGQELTRWARRLCSSTGVAGLARRLWPGYLGLLAVVQLVPFDFTINAAELGAKQEEGKIFLSPFASYAQYGVVAALAKMFIHGLCFAPLGFLRALAHESDRSANMSWPRVLLFGLVVAAVVEGLQLFVYSRVFDATDILLGTAAIAIGWHAGKLFRQSWSRSLSGSEMVVGLNISGLTWGTLVVAWLAIVLYFQWSPFDFSVDPARFRSDSEGFAAYGLRRFSWFPLADYYWGSKYNALDQFLKKTLAFMPLGVLFALAQTRLYDVRAYRRLLLTAISLALVIEIGRYFLPSRSPSTTDLLISSFGAWLGFALVQHVRVVFWAERTLFSPLHRGLFATMGDFTGFRQNL